MIINTVCGVAVRGLGTMVGVDGAEAAVQAWSGFGKLALSLNPAVMMIDQTVGVPRMERGELGAIQMAAGKALIAYDMWGEDPARASGAVVGNVVGAVIGTKGAGAAIKGSGTAVKTAEVAGRPRTWLVEVWKGSVRPGSRPFSLKANLTDSLTGKMAGLGDKLPISKLSPEPALAAGAGGRGASRFDMNPGTYSVGSSLHDATRGSSRTGPGVELSTDHRIAARSDGVAGIRPTTADHLDAREDGFASEIGHDFNLAQREMSVADGQPGLGELGQGDLGGRAVPGPETSASGDSVPDSGTSQHATTEMGTGIADELPAAHRGKTVYRVYGSPLDSAGNTMTSSMPNGSVRTWGSGPHGRSWTPVDPESVPDFRWSAGLPNENPGRFLIRGELVKPENVADIRRALELDGNPGGLPEYLIDDAADAIEINEVRGLNERWTHDPGSFIPPKD